jgi:hypothetical protein
MLWKIERIYDGDQHYDEAQGFVIRAHSEQTARALATARHLEDYNVDGSAFLDPKKSTCEVVPVEGPDGIIMTDVLEG